MSIVEWMEKQNVVYIMQYYSALKDEWNSDMCYNMNKSWRHANCNKLDTKGQILFDSFYVRYLVIKFPESEVEWWLPGASRQGRITGLMSLGSWKRDGWWRGYIPMWIYLMPLKW